MRYPEGFLSDNERVVLDLRPHWLKLLPPLLWAILIVALTVTAMLVGVATVPPLLIVIVVVALTALTALTVIPFLGWSTTQFILTSERLISREGILAKRAQEIPLNRINNVAFGQTLLERMVGSGNLSIESAGEHGLNRFVFIRHPEKVQHEIYKAMEIYEKSLAGGTEAPPDIPAQIEKLAALRDKGIVTAEEFEKKKKELLERM
jgi:uncharacterized membrane protein YdbT with pleckstrin-like domain